MDCFIDAQLAFRRLSLCYSRLGSENGGKECDHAGGF